VARRARRYLASPTRRLVLPALELAYVLGGVQHAPCAILAEKMLPLTRSAVDGLASLKDEGKGKVKEMSAEKPDGKLPEGYWDDRSLARFLQGVCARYIAYPVCWCPRLHVLVWANLLGIRTRKRLSRIKTSVLITRRRKRRQRLRLRTYSAGVQRLSWTIIWYSIPVCLSHTPPCLTIHNDVMTIHRLRARPITRMRRGQIWCEDALRDRSRRQASRTEPKLKEAGQVLDGGASP
jgi:hypothetical protein